MWNTKIAKICKEVKNAQLAQVLGPIFGHYSSFCILHFFSVFFCIYTLYFCFSADPILMLVLPPCYRWWQTRRGGLKQKSHGQTHRWGPGPGGGGMRNLLIPRSHIGRLFLDVMCALPEKYFSWWETRFLVTEWYYVESSDGITDDI